jgi:hypothetical protein
MPDYVVALFSGVGALTVSILGYVVLLSLYLVCTMYWRASTLRRNVENERDDYIDDMLLSVVDDASESRRPGAAPPHVPANNRAGSRYRRDRDRDGDVPIVEGEDGLPIVVDEYAKGSICHLEERELKGWWARGHGHYTEDSLEDHSSLGEDFHFMFQAFKAGTTLFVLLCILLMYIQAWHHKDRLAFLVLCLLVLVVSVVAFLRGVYWSSVDQLTTSYAINFR